MAEFLGPFELGRVHHADCLDAMRELPDGCVQCCVTSPPYWGLRKYDIPDTVWGGRPDCEHDWGAEGKRHVGGPAGPTAGVSRSSVAAQEKVKDVPTGSFCRLCGAWRGQLGLEPTPDLYVSHMVSIFREVRRVLRDDGTLWLNIGDGYASSSTYNTTNTLHTMNGWKQDGAHRPNAGVPDGCKPKDLIGIPWLLAFALRADGWYLRAEIIWHKTAPMPESVRDRPTRAHEQVFLLSKSADYFYNADEASEPASGTAHPRGNGVNPKTAGAKRGTKQNASFSAAVSKLVDRRNWRSVWTIGPEPNNAAHYAPFPREVARRCIVAGSKAGDVVLDPFAGTGTAVRVADGLKRKAIGFDLGDSYAAQANERSGIVGPETAEAGQQLGLLTAGDR